MFTIKTLSKRPLNGKRAKNRTEWGSQFTAGCRLTCPFTHRASDDPAPSYPARVYSVTAGGRQVNATRTLRICASDSALTANAFASLRPRLLSALRVIGVLEPAGGARLAAGRTLERLATALGVFLGAGRGGAVRSSARLHAQWTSGPPNMECFPLGRKLQPPSSAVLCTFGSGSSSVMLCSTLSVVTYVHLVIACW